MEYQKLRSGGKMPIFGYGTYILNIATELELEISLNKALETGYRLIDTAYGYLNEHVIGKVLNEWISSGKITRDELFIITKLPPYGNHAEEVEKYIKKSLSDLKLEYIDMYLMHTPFGVFKDGKSQYTEMKRDDSTDHLKIWKAMEKQVDDGLTKAIGLSNFNIKQIQRILDNSRIKPDVIENENHLYIQEPELVKFCNDNEIKVIAYSSLGMKAIRESMNISWTNKELPEMLQNKVLLKVAKKHGKTPAQTLLRFIVQRNITVIPNSTNTQHLLENIQIFDFKLDSEDMKALKAQDAGEGGRILRFLFFPKIEHHPEYPFLIQY